MSSAFDNFEVLTSRTSEHKRQLSASALKAIFILEARAVLGERDVQRDEHRIRAGDVPGTEGGANHRHFWTGTAFQQLVTEELLRTDLTWPNCC